MVRLVKSERVVYVGDRFGLGAERAARGSCRRCGHIRTGAVDDYLADVVKREFRAV